MPCHFSTLLQTDCDETASMMQDMPMHHDHHSPQQTDTTMAHCCEHASLCSATLYPELTLVTALKPQPILTPLTTSWSAILPASLGNTVFRPPISS